MPYIHLKRSPLVPNRRSVTIHYRTEGQGIPLVFLHGGWGYCVYPLDYQIPRLRDHFRFLIPDRCGYGRSTHMTTELPINFHQKAAKETLRFLDELNIKSAFFWGHSDGAVIGAWIGLMEPKRVRGLVLEAFHFYRAKPQSLEFYKMEATDPDKLPPALCEKLAVEHGKRYWKTVVKNGGRVWLRIGEQSSSPTEDLYRGTLGGLIMPALVIQGGKDPRTEPSEISAVKRALPEANIQILAAGYHSPHSEKLTEVRTTRIVQRFLQSC